MVTGPITQKSPLAYVPYGYRPSNVNLTPSMITWSVVCSPVVGVHESPSGSYPSSHVQTGSPSTTTQRPCPEQVIPAQGSSLSALHPVAASAASARHESIFFMESSTAMQWKHRDLSEASGRLSASRARSSRGACRSTGP